MYISGLTILGVLVGIAGMGLVIYLLTSYIRERQTEQRVKHNQHICEPWHEQFVGGAIAEQRLKKESGKNNG